MKPMTAWRGFDFYQQTYGRNSIDDQGLKLDATVHFGKDYDNAFWNSVQMVFGDGNGKIFNRFTIYALDVIGHELTHGVTEVEAQLQYFNQSGALNESASDVFGSMIKQFVLKQTADQADWLIGAGLLAAGVHGVALRSHERPGSAFDDPILGKDPQPKDMANYVNTFEDNGGVHINSGTRISPFMRWPSGSAALPGKNLAESGTKPCGLPTSSPMPILSPTQG